MVLQIPLRESTQSPRRGRHHILFLQWQRNYVEVLEWQWYTCQHACCLVAILKQHVERSALSGFHVIAATCSSFDIACWTDQQAVTNLHLFSIICATSPTLEEALEDVSTTEVARQVVRLLVVITVLLNVRGGRDVPNVL